MEIDSSAFANTLDMPLMSRLDIHTGSSPCPDFPLLSIRVQGKLQLASLERSSF